jgi:predicted transposase/invertase (TIGR01784 family)
MNFINPKTDYAFKKIFGSEQSQDILISFLNAIVYKGEAIIASLEIIDPYAPGRIAGLKTSYFDVKARLNNGENVLIEMQAFNVPAFSSRLVYNTAKMYANQLKLGEAYPDLRAAIGVAVTNFVMFDGMEKVISQFILAEEELQIKYPKCPLKLVCVELPKFAKNLEELTTITDKWLYFLQKAPDLEMIPTTMAIVPEIEKAFTIANRVNLSKEESDDLEKREQFDREQKGAIQLGIEEGIAAKTAEIRAESIKFGEKQGQINLIKQLLQGRFGELNPTIENSLVQLSSDDLSSLAATLFNLSSLTDLANWLENHRPN